MLYSVLLYVFRCQFKKEFRDFLADVSRKYDHTAFYYCNACDALLTKPNVLWVNAAAAFASSTVKGKERNANIPFEVIEITDAIDNIITLQEMTELTTATLFGTYAHETDDDRLNTKRATADQAAPVTDDIASMPL
ncbi:unnamed protein product [Heligmosomoides polygyrus]|uniref:Rep_fac-A_C domain-containing protein n=1 Tax=Heligmosomoides polygyrus TaxID=6339 RepID=A0A183G3U0_HELPZ|nr:unnamed protein product [Heligmosomoides polygyrus]